MKYLLLVTCISLFACAAVPVSKSIPANNVESNFTTNKPMDKAWDALLQFTFNNKYIIKSQFKGESNASMRVEILNAPISYFDKKTKKVADSNAIAITNVRKRINNNVYVYPVAGTIECVLSLNKQSDGQVYVSVLLDKTGTLTQFIENYFLNKKKQIPNVEIHTTGIIEDKLRAYLLNL